MIYLLSTIPYSLLMFLLEHFFCLRYDNVPPEINRLRCRVNYHALKFLPDIEQMADSLASRMRNRTGSSNPYMYVASMIKIFLKLKCRSHFLVPVV